VEFAESIGALYFETSAKEDMEVRNPKKIKNNKLDLFIIKVEEMFAQLATSLPNSSSSDPSSPTSVVSISEAPPEKNKTGCC